MSMKALIIESLCHGPLTVAGIIAATGASDRYIRTCLEGLEDLGLARKGGKVKAAKRGRPGHEWELVA